ncbi:MAG: hypothetical protein II200_07185 [Bacteroidaceae bacterium]|nr:hypothetical protein [Bacteroidaceae bacterium]
MRSIIFSLLLFPLCLTAQEDTTFKQLFEHFRQASTYNKLYPREKVYLHLDNNAYLTGDSIWYKAYVVRNSTLNATDVSKVLYVELLDESGRMMHRQTLKIDEQGGCNGCLPLQLPVRDGYYEVRAYTRAMLNWGEHAYFSRVIPVFSIENNKLHISEVDKKWKLAHNAKRKFNFEKQNKHCLNFFPESGHRINEHTQRIAYALTYNDGRFATDTLHVYNSQDSLIAISVPLHEGRGLFLLPSEVNEGYVAIGTERFDLPKAHPIGYSMRVDMTAEYLDVRVERSAEISSTAIGLAIFNRENVCYFDTLRMEQKIREFSIPMCCLHNGINRIELFDIDGKSLASRMVYRPLKPNGLNMNIAQNQASYAPYAPIAIEMQLQDSLGKLEHANLSLSVRDANSELTTGNEWNINTEMLLSSEIRGYIHNPEFYFSTLQSPVDSSFRSEALDHLLLVQGWRAVDFDRMSNYIPFDVEHIAEEGLMLRGIVYKDNEKKEPLNNSRLKIKMHNALGQAVEGEAMLDSLGKFSFISDEDYNGEMITHLSVENKKGKNIWARVAFDRWFSPTPRKFSPLETKYEMFDASTHLLDTTKTQKPKLFEWQDTLNNEDGMLLGTAEVIGKRKSILNGNRYLWEGGLSKGLKYSDDYYDVVLELERWRDQGREGMMNVVSLVSWLVDSTENWQADVDAAIAINSKPINEFDNLEKSDNGENSTDESQNTLNVFMTTLNGKQTAWVLNNELLKKHEGVILLAEEVGAFVVIDKPNFINKYMQEAKMKHLANAGPNKYGIATSDVEKGYNQVDQLIALYERPNSYLYRSNKKDLKRTVWGYEPEVSFYSPDYTGKLLPEKSDIRRTLFWNPQVTFDKDGKASAVFFNNSHDGTQLRISIQGITQDGRFVSYER